MVQTARTEFAQALKAVATERGLELDVILETIKQAIIAAYKRDARDRGEETEEMDYDVEIHPVTGETKVGVGFGVTVDVGLGVRGKGVKVGVGFGVTVDVGLGVVAKERFGETEPEGCAIQAPCGSTHPVPAAHLTCIYPVPSTLQDSTTLEFTHLCDPEAQTFAEAGITLPQQIPPLHVPTPLYLPIRLQADGPK